jgi:hypothetical protein
MDRKEVAFMSMLAKFVQVDSAELAKLQADPSLAEPLFEEESLATAMPAFAKLAKTVQDRMRAAGPQQMAGALSRLDSRMREEVEKRLGVTTSALAAGAGGDAFLKLMEERMTRITGLDRRGGTHDRVVGQGLARRALPIVR